MPLSIEGRFLPGLCTVKTRFSHLHSYASVCVSVGGGCLLVLFVFNKEWIKGKLEKFLLPLKIFFCRQHWIFSITDSSLIASLY